MWKGKASGEAQRRDGAGRIGHGAINAISAISRGARVGVVFVFFHMQVQTVAVCKGDVADFALWQCKTQEREEKEENNK